MSIIGCFYIALEAGDKKKDKLGTYRDSPPSGEAPVAPTMGVGTRKRSGDPDLIVVVAIAKGARTVGLG